MRTIGTRLFLVTVALAAAASQAAAGATPAQKCEQAKNGEAAKYAACRQKVEGKFAVGGDGAARTAALAKCASKYAAKWPALETKATMAGGACPSVGDAGPIQAVIDAHTTNVATALAGGTLSDCPADLGTCASDLEACTDDLAACESGPTLVGTTITGTPAVDPSCDGDVGFDVAVQSNEPGPVPAGSFYFQCVGGCGGAQPSWSAPAETPVSSAHFDLATGGFPGATLTIRISFVPALSPGALSGTTPIAAPSPFGASQIVYTIQVPAGPGCPVVTPESSAPSSTHLQGWSTLVDLACANDQDDFPVRASIVPARAAAALEGTFVFECGGGPCPVSFFISPTTHVAATDPVSRVSGTATASFATPHFDWVPGSYFVQATFVPDRADVLPSRFAQVLSIATSPSCPTDVVDCTNGVPGTDEAFCGF